MISVMKKNQQGKRILSEDDKVGFIPELLAQVFFKKLNHFSHQNLGKIL